MAFNLRFADQVHGIVKMKRVRRYYSLIVVEKGDRWRAQFGDYDRDCVRQELEDTKHDYPRGTLFKVITTGDRGIDIVDALAALNRGI